jgi:hypothetical protein
VPHLLRHGTSFFKVISERPVILTSECRAFGEGAITTNFKRLRFDAAGTSGARTHGLLDTTNLDILLALMAFSNEGSFTCHTCCDTGPPLLRKYPKPL